MTNVVTLSFVALQLVCGDPGSWRFASEARTLEPGVEELTVVLENAAEAVPPEFEVAWSLPQRDIPHFWHVAQGGDCGIPPDWGGDCVSSLTRCAPVYSLFSAANENRLATAADDARRTVRFKAGLREESCTVECSWRFFTEKTVPSRKETVRIRFDTRKVFWSDAVRDAAGWIARSAGYVPLAVPDAARAPLYSAWYSFHQNVFDKEIEAETYRYSGGTFSTRQSEGRVPLVSVSYSTQSERLLCPKGSIVVDMDQPNAKLAVYLFEPDAPGSLTYWGFFNSHVQPGNEFWINQAYMEVKGREMLQTNSAIRAEFEQKMKDPSFAGSPDAILNYFYEICRKQSHQDNELHPVWRLMD